MENENEERTMRLRIRDVRETVGGYKSLGI